MQVEVKTRIWLETNTSKFMGKGHMQLLHAIKEEGSLSAASKRTGISYRKTWRLINQINTHARHEVVHLKKGGTGGGGATVTEYGIELLAFFETLLKESERVLQEQLHIHKNLWE